MVSFIWQHRSSRSRSVAALSRSRPPQPAQINSTAPGGDVLQLRQHLVHDDVVGEGLLTAGLFLLHPQSQLLHGAAHLLLLADIAAQLLLFRAGKADAPPVQHRVGAALRLMMAAAHAAGHPEPELHTVRLRLQCLMSAFTLHPRRGGGQGEHAALVQHRLAAGRT